MSLPMLDLKCENCQGAFKSWDKTMSTCAPCIRKKTKMPELKDEFSN